MKPGVLNRHFTTAFAGLAPAALFAAQQSVVARSWLEIAADVAMILLALTLVGLLAVLLQTLNEFRKSHERLIEFAERVKEDVAPTIRQVNAVADNLKVISDAAVKQVGAADETLTAANEHLRSTVDRAYKRVKDFDALLQVFQEEAEELLVSTASGLRGFRRGAGFLFGRGRKRRGRARGLDDARRRRSRVEARFRVEDPEMPDEDAAEHDPVESGPSIRARGRRDHD